MATLARVKTLGTLAALALALAACSGPADPPAREPFCYAGGFATCELDLEAGVTTLALCFGEDGGAGTPWDCGTNDEGEAIVVPCPDGTLPVCQ